MAEQPNLINKLCPFDRNQLQKENEKIAESIQGGPFLK